MNGGHRRLKAGGRGAILNWGKNLMNRGTAKRILQLTQNRWKTSRAASRRGREKGQGRRPLLWTLKGEQEGRFRSSWKRMGTRRIPEREIYKAIDSLK